MLKPYKKSNSSLYAFTFLISFASFSGAMLGSNIVSAETTTVDASVNVPVSCSLSGTGMNSHNADVPNGTYQADIGITTLKAMCNDSEGFAIYAIGYTGDQYSGDDHTKLIGANTNQKITTSTATSGSTSSWAMKLAAVSSPTPVYPITLDNGYGSYSAVPSTYTKVAHRDSGTDVGTNATGAQLTTTYASFISSTQTADNYSGKVKYALVHPSNETPLQPQPATAGCINYFPNGSNVLGTMGCQSASDGNDIVLLASNFSREGYGFAGWSDAFDYATNQNAHFYGPQETITVPTGTTANGLSLYAVWIKSQGSLQDSTKVAQLCGTGVGSLTTAPTNGNANLASVSALTDSRDNETYAIAKLADGKCWMIENLRLEADDTTSAEDIALAQGYGTSSTYGNFSGLADAESAKFSNSTTANSLYYSGTQSGTASINIGTSNSPGYRMPRYNNLNTPANASNRPQNPTSNTFTDNNTTVGMYSYGNYYTWHAAVADLTYNGTNNSSVSNTSLCPAGWHLPKGGNKSNEANNDFWSLVVTGINGGTNPANYGSSTQPYYTGSPEASDMSKALRAYPNNFLYSGRFYASSASNRGRYGYYWSSTASNNGSSCRLLLGSSNVNPGTDYSSKDSGYSIRCTVSAGT